MKSRRIGFTLIELLVVIAIIAILAAILFPVFAQARAKARQTVCLSNCKQMALAMQQYKQDYDERWIDVVPGFNELGMGSLPTTPSGNPATDYGPPWTYCFNPIPTVNGNTVVPMNYQLSPYTKNKDVLACPTLHTVPQPGKVIKYPMYAMNGIYGDGSANYPLAPDYNPVTNAWHRNGPYGRSDAALTHPSDFVIMWEHNNPFMYCEHWPNQDTLDPNKKVGETDVYGDLHWGSIHTGGFNASFADGHAKRFQSTQLKNQNVCYWTLPVAP